MLNPNAKLKMQFRPQKPFPKDKTGNDIESPMTKPINYYATKEMVGKMGAALLMFLTQNNC